MSVYAIIKTESTKSFLRRYWEQGQQVGQFVTALGYTPAKGVTADAKVWQKIVRSHENKIWRMSVVWRDGRSQGRTTEPLPISLWAQEIELMPDGDEQTKRIWSKALPYDIAQLKTGVATGQATLKQWFNRHPK